MSINLLNLVTLAGTVHWLQIFPSELLSSNFWYSACSDIQTDGKRCIRAFRALVEVGSEMKQLNVEVSTPAIVCYLNLNGASQRSNTLSKYKQSLLITFFIW